MVPDCNNFPGRWSTGMSPSGTICVGTGGVARDNRRHDRDRHCRVAGWRGRETAVFALAAHRKIREAPQEVPTQSKFNESAPPPPPLGFIWSRPVCPAAPGACLRRRHPANRNRVRFLLRHHARCPEVLLRYRPGAPLLALALHRSPKLGHRPRVPVVGDRLVDGAHLRPGEKEFFRVEPIDDQAPTVVGIFSSSDRRQPSGPGSGSADPPLPWRPGIRLPLALRKRTIRRRGISIP